MMCNIFYCLALAFSPACNFFFKPAADLDLEEPLEAAERFGGGLFLPAVLVLGVLALIEGVDGAELTATIH